MKDYPHSSYTDYFAARKVCLCPVRTEYALRLIDSDTLRAWHEQPEENPAAFDIEDIRVPDAALAAIIERTAGCPPALVHTLPSETLEPILRRLIREEGAHIPQLVRLTGLSSRPDSALCNVTPLLSLSLYVQKTVGLSPTVCMDIF